MFEGLSGKRAIVTGGATLIGAAVVRALCAQGVKVTLADIDAERGDRVADSCGEGVWFSQTDITQNDQLEKCVQGTVQRFGGLDIVINLACSYVDDGL